MKPRARAGVNWKQKWPKRIPIFTSLNSATAFLLNSLRLNFFPRLIHYKPIMIIMIGSFGRVCGLNNKRYWQSYKHKCYRYSRRALRLFLLFSSMNIGCKAMWNSTKPLSN